MSMNLDDTIAAIASAPGTAIRGILRISGPSVREVLTRILNESSLPDHIGAAQAFSVSLPVAEGTLSVPAQLLFWPNQRSFTGEPLAEIHLVGSPPLLEELLERICLSGARPAERGEFTLRAFLAGRIDLMQAEAVLGVIDATDSSELTTALEQLGGGLSSQIAAAREQLLLHLADLEAGLDFVEEDIDFVSRPELTARLDEAARWIELLLSQADNRLQSTGRWRVVLAGLPNAGKSTLFNRLVGTDAALVSAVAGTTRDYLSVPIRCGNVEVDLVDTAGWEEARDGIEQAAALLRDDQFQRAHLIVWCAAADWDANQQALDRQLLDQVRQSRDVLQVHTKVDSIPRRELETQDDSLCRVSAEQGTGLESLRDAIGRHLSSSHGHTEMIGSTAARCTESLHHAHRGIQRARHLVDLQAGDELIALELRDVLEQLGRLTGKVYTDDILDRIFSRFCIGK